MNVLIIGRGRVGSALQRALRASNRHDVVTVGRRIKPASVREADAVILAVPDDSIETVARTIAPELKRGTAVLHCAGARGISELRACEEQGAAVGIMHPLISFPSARRSPNLAGATFTVSGSPRALATVRRIARSCGAHVVLAQTADPAYHAAAALAANGAAALAYVSVRVLERLGFDRREAEHAIGGLLKSVGDNVEHLGVPAALTGPVARGQSEVVVRHRTALRRTRREALRAYDAVLPVIVRCARAAGLPNVQASKILRALES